jgi:prephenate dehydratase
VRTKCSIVFRPRRNIVGVLFRILGVFALRDINLLKIESRPDPRSPFSYLFYVDLEGNPLEPQTARALEHLQEMTSLYRLLGAYPADPNESKVRR